MNSRIQKKVILLVDDMVPATGGGIASWAIQLTHVLIRKGCEVTVFSHRKMKPDSVKLDPSVKIIYVPGRDWNKTRGFFMTIALIPCLFNSGRYHIIAATWMHAEGLAALRWLFKFSLICFAHGTDISKALYSNRRNRLNRVLRKTDVFIPVSEFHNLLIGKEFPDLSLKGAVIHNGIDTRHFKPADRAAESKIQLPFKPDDAFILLSVGRVIQAKGYELVIRALPEIKKAIPNVHYLIAGQQDEPEYSHLKQLSHELGVQTCVHFLSKIGYQDLPELYHAAQLFVLTSKPIYEPFYQEDNFPMVLLEAAACGLPSIGTYCGGIPEIIEEGVTGFLVPVDNHHSLAGKVITLHENEPLRQQMGINARERILRFFDKEKVMEPLWAYLGEDQEKDQAD